MRDQLIMITGAVTAIRHNDHDNDGTRPIQRTLIKKTIQKTQRNVLGFESQTRAISVKSNLDVIITETSESTQATEVTETFLTSSCNLTLYIILPEQNPMKTIKSNSDLDNVQNTSEKSATQLSTTLPFPQFGRAQSLKAISIAFTEENKQFSEYFSCNKSTR